MARPESSSARRCAQDWIAARDKPLPCRRARFLPAVRNRRKNEPPPVWARNHPSHLPDLLLGTSQKTRRPDGRVVRRGHFPAGIECKGPRLGAGAIWPRTARISSSLAL